MGQRKSIFNLSFVDKSSRNYTGRAAVTYQNNDLYEGEFVDGLRHGFGMYTYGETGNKYEGEWANNLKHGIGKMIFANEGEYFGRFENGKRHGEGVFKYKNKNIYSGSWLYGNKHGKGTYIFDDTKMKIVGEWNEGKIIEGKWVFPNGTYFEGKFENNLPKGSGVWHFANGNTTVGEFNHTTKDRDDEEEGTITVIDWKTNPEIVDPTRYRDIY